MNTGYLSSALCLAIACIISEPSQAADELTSRATLRGDAQLNATDVFGGSIATDGPWLIVGAPHDPSSRGQPDGAVYIYRRQANGPYVRTQKIAGTQTAASGDLFGAGVAVGAGWLFIAAANNQEFPGTDPRRAPGGEAFSFAGKVFVYQLIGDTWVLRQQLASPQPGTSGAFGSRRLSKHMALNNDASRIVIGEPITPPQANLTARIHVFKRDGITWSQAQPPIDVATDTPTVDFHAADSIVWLGKHVVVKVLKRELPNPDPSGGIHNRPVSSEGMLFVFEARAGLLSTSPTQIVGRVIHDPNTCAPDFSSEWGFSGMAAGGRVFASAQPCLGTPNGQQLGRLDIYDYIESQREPLVFKQSIDGPTRQGRLGSTVAGGQESVAVSSDGRRILVGSAIGGPHVQVPASPLTTASLQVQSDNVHLYQFDQGRWALRASLRLPEGAKDMRLFGHAVGFGQFVSGVDALAPVLVAEPGVHISPNGPKGAVHVYELPAQ